MSDSTSSETAPWAVLVDLDYAAVSGFRTLCALYKEAFAEKGATLSDARFAASLLGEPSVETVATLLKTLAPDASREAAEEIQDAVAARFAREIAKAAPLATTAPILQKAIGKGCKLIFVSSLENADVTDGVVQALGLDPEETSVTRTSEPWGHHSRRAWEKAIKLLDLVDRPDRCIVFLNTTASVRGAIATGAKVVAIASDMTEALDFSGCDYVISENAPAKELAKALDEIFANVK